MPPPGPEHSKFTVPISSKRTPRVGYELPNARFATGKVGLKLVFKFVANSLVDAGVYCTVASKGVFVRQADKVEIESGQVREELKKQLGELITVQPADKALVAEIQGLRADLAILQKVVIAAIASGVTAIVAALAAL